jgi:hypothetical protein
MRGILLTILSIMIVTNSFGQLSFKIIIEDKVYEPKILTAIEQIRTTDASYYCMLTDYCTRIKIEKQPHKEADSTIMYIPLSIVCSPSLNRLSAWIVRESFLLRMKDVGKNLASKDKLYLANKYELEFLAKLPKEHPNSLRERLKRFFESKKNQLPDTPPEEDKPESKDDQSVK